MSDQCVYCTNRGNIEKCESAECSQHDSWYPRYYKSLYEATDARMRAAEKVIRQIDDDNQEGARRVTDISNYGAYQEWCAAVRTHEKAVKEINHVVR